MGQIGGKETYKGDSSEMDDLDPVSLQSASKHLHELEKNKFAGGYDALANSMKKEHDTKLEAGCKDARPMETLARFEEYKNKNQNSNTMNKDESSSDSSGWPTSPSGGSTSDKTQSSSNSSNSSNKSKISNHGKIVLDPINGLFAFLL